MKEREYDMMRKIFKGVRGLQIADIEWLSVYSDLVRARFEDLISTSFPLFKGFLKEEEFEEIITSFVKEDHAHPLLIDLTREFVEFFTRGSFRAKERLPFLDELLRHEWLEIELFNEKEVPPGEPESWSWDKPLMLAPSSRLVTYTYPVHEAYDLKEKDLMSLKGCYHLLVFRDARNYEVKSIQLTEFVFRFLDDITSGVAPITSLNRSLRGEEMEEAKPYLDNFVRELIKVGALL